MKELLEKLLLYKSLSREEAKSCLLEIGHGNVNAAQMSAFMTVYMMRSIKVEELAGFRDAMLEMCLSVDLSEFDPIDMCGTGGDGKDTFNISTCASFVVAGAGIAVAKHGNYGVSSAVGSSTLMEHVGYTFTNNADVLKRQLDKAGICMLHAPLFHPAMKHVGPVRKELGLRTFFNMLGPTANPASPKRQLTGVFNLELARLYTYLFQEIKKQFVVIHSLDVYDEISLTAPVKILSNMKEQVYSPEQLGFSSIKPEQILNGGSVEASASIFTQVLENKATEAQRNVVLANAGMAIWCALPQQSLDHCMAMAKESLESGKALASFKTLLATQ
ncbi:MAG: anthranilate phosphoribosyltransferase [Cytophagaceae bacterium]|jgi:anthranilate phosphoribosyltransferase|nr:anthranilate phosphoribosyltransferase [Cytophagaceae bacterium]